MSMFSISNSDQLCNTENVESETITDTGEILSDKKPNGKERPWTKHKKDSSKLHHLYSIAKKIDPDCISPSSFKALETCASFLLYKISATGEKKLKNADFCRARLCPMCNWRKSLKMFGQASRITDRMLKDYPTTRFIFVTFTLKNCTGEDLEATINDMNEGFSKLTAKSRKFAFSAGFKSNMLGYLRAIEVTYNQQVDTYHPHIHAIFAMKASYFKGENYIKQADWQKMWKACLELEYEPLVNVQVVKPKKANSTVSGLDMEATGTKKQALVNAVAETAKYPVKMDGIINLEPEEIAVKVIIVLSKALRNKRLVTFGGLFAEIRKELNLDDIENGDLVHADDSEINLNEVAQILFKWRMKVGCYVC